jgi:hypothetical protein
MLNIFDDVYISDNLKLSKKKLIDLLVDNKEYLDSIDPHDLEKLYNKTGLNVERMFITNSRNVVIDKHSFKTDDFTLFDSFKQNTIQKIEKSRESHKDEEMYKLYQSLGNNIILVTKVDSILYTRKNGFLYSVTIAKNKRKYNLKVDGLFN